MIVSHLSFGIVLSVILVVRIAWRLMAWEPGARGPIGWQDRIAKAGHLLLYVLLVAEAVLGFIFRWSGGEPMSFFGLLMPSPFAPFSEDAHHSIHAAHEVTGWLIVILAAGHALAALVHHYVLRDDVLKRMLPWRHAIGN